MTDCAIRVEGLSKEYVLDAREKGYRTFREAVLDSVAASIRRLRAFGHEPPADQPFWALKDINFEVKPGEIVGIIGRNGAGKSTLLKILSRITAPTEGRVEIRGRVASLLEVGTGFHPELTGRENIYLNGAILGMSRTEIAEKFDEIVDFAEVEKFLDTPIKRYSSGMYARLAFAVAAHLEPDILIIDEVLAVGDAQFQKKCLNQMSAFTRSGRTVLFVSHNIGAIKQICGSCLYLKEGVVRMFGATGDVALQYSSERAQQSQLNSAYKLGADLELVNLHIATGNIESANSASFEIVLRALEETELFDLTVLIEGPAGERVAIIDCRTPSYPHPLDAGSCFVFRGNVETLPLVEGQYSLGLFYRARHSSAYVQGLADLMVSETPRTTRPLCYAAEHRGFIALQCSIEPVKKFAPFTYDKICSLPRTGVEI